jgi:hypothetical protein
MSNILQIVTQIEDCCPRRRGTVYTGRSEHRIYIEIKISVINILSNRCTLNVNDIAVK